MRKRSTKDVLAVLLLAGLGVVTYWQVQHGAFSKQKKSASAKGRAAVKEVESAGLPGLVEVTLKDQPAVKIRSYRNLFNYARSPDELENERLARVAAEKADREAEERRRKQAEIDAQAAREQAERLAKNPPPPPPPPINFRFLGKIGDPRSPIAVIEEIAAGGDKWTVREGEVILEKYKVIKIDFDSVTIGFSDAAVAKNPNWAQETKTIRMGS